MEASLEVDMKLTRASMLFSCVFGLMQFRNLLKFAKNTVTTYDLAYSRIKITLQPNPRLQYVSEISN